MAMESPRPGKTLLGLSHCRRLCCLALPSKSSGAPRCCTESNSLLHTDSTELVARCLLLNAS